MKVAIADDSDLMRDRLKQLLESFDNVEVVGEAKNSIEARKLIDKVKPDVLLLDIRMPGGSGLEVLKDIKEYKINTKIIMLTNYPYPQYKEKCLQLGAEYFLSKAEEFDKLESVLDEIYYKYHAQNEG